MEVRREDRQEVSRDERKLQPIRRKTPLQLLTSDLYTAQSSDTEPHYLTHTHRHTHTHTQTGKWEQDEDGASRRRCVDTALQLDTHQVLMRRHPLAARRQAHTYTHTSF